MISPQEFFSLLSDETRLRSLLLLQKEKELCVCEICAVLEIIQPKISRHLSLLRNSGMVQDERKGQWVYYRLNEKIPKWAKEFLKSFLNELATLEPFKSDLLKLASLRKDSCCNT